MYMQCVFAYIDLVLLKKDSNIKINFLIDINVSIHVRTYHRNYTFVQHKGLLNIALYLN